ncbi:HAD superfamily hydrolase (TIGR01509 family)/HAD superfamily hydrolase (TIGR01549 family)/beta-phosphoglucomutase family hydrolase [Winogradskyella epiphytica]|uniref:HAD superfamily hydrolase (TIGR01509 family)/HAD superfamily hydrolase (TIGR01549 family)/beta-phosphoglucomutase family hydrolase n=1 Tax=Winogradskyella epiphytica TaxID=262005 RepID=A0A2V4X8B5_9FLAO|nr:HAD family phosphatase [Winogradskyella epiphytica]PYE81839.1 HAD superfamily hydrolase (TIGR01509 family)/HAD superfamily hydrolase (TIGR01549 family)/beta-phosphoglucomutase family hydrolase [Winogradskyella epiphytica]GGW62294.1 ABC transporter ATP-binding protein [Winogradskyella epiphytica]
MLKAVLFDMDGVIVDTEPLHHKAYHQMFNDVNINVSDNLYESFTGQSTINICKRLVEQFSLEDKPEQLVSLKRKHFKYLFENDSSLTLIDGVLERIKDYHENGLSLVVASSASMPNINRIFDRFELNQYFIGKFSGADLKQSKPHPEIFLKAAEFTGFEKSECMVIEDSTNGIQAAHAAGIFCVGFKSPHSVNQDYSKADIVISNFKEIAYSKNEIFFRM